MEILHLDVEVDKAILPGQFSRGRSRYLGLRR
jgi:hypothetical protein